MERIILAEGKYEILYNFDPEEGEIVFSALRYGEPWRDLTGDNLIFYLAHRISELEYELGKDKEE